MSILTMLLSAVALPLANDVPHVPAGAPLAGGPTELFATYAAVAGDVDGDGVGDLIVSSIDDAGPPWGVARVFSGADQHMLFEFVFGGATSFLDRPVAGGGDVNGDGLGDVLVGSPTEDTVYVLAGPDGSLLHTLTGPVPGDGFGGAVASAGDLDGDGLDDVIVGATGLTSPGYALVHSGADGSVLLFLHAEAGQRFGQAVSSLGDVSGDGVPDLVVSAPNGGRDVRNPGLPPFVPPFLTDDDAGRIYVFSGADGSTLWSAVGDLPYDGLGWSVAAAGDVDADGYDDVAVASRGGGPDHVAVRIFSGSTGRPVFGWNPAAPPLSGRITVAGPGDLDGDGRADFAIAESQNVIGGGLVQVFISR